VRRITPEERDLFLAAISGRLPKRLQSKNHQAKVKKAAGEKTPEKPLRTTAKPPIHPGLRQVSEEEFDLFLEAVGKRAKKVAATPVFLAPAAAVKPRGARNPGGLDGNTKRRLEKGEIAPNAKLDLHGMTEAAAHGALLTFLHAAHRRGDRLVLVVTGKGALSGHAPYERYGGVLRQMVPRWLQEAPMAAVIAEKRWAHRRHGGDGALYVYLKKR